MSSLVTQLHGVDLYTVLIRLATQVADTSVDLDVVECDYYFAPGMREDCVKWGIAYEICQFSISTLVGVMVSRDADNVLRQF
jgi:hypothetical protein